MIVAEPPLDPDHPRGIVVVTVAPEDAPFSDADELEAHRRRFRMRMRAAVDSLGPP
jgi:hypothetical protein